MPKGDDKGHLFFSRPGGTHPKPPPQLPRNIARRPIKLPPMVPIHEKAIELRRAELDGQE